MVSKVNKNAMRLKRHVRVRGKISGTAECPRLNVFRSNANIYAQIIDDVNGVTLVAANTLEKGFEGATGNAEAAKEAFATQGRVAGDAMATAVTLMDGVIVIGGGLAGASKYFMPALLEEMRSKIKTMSGDTLNRVQMSVYNLDDKEEFKKFAAGNSKKIKVYGSDKEVVYDPVKRVGVTISDIGASNAVSLGAYLYAINNI